MEILHFRDYFNTSNIDKLTLDKVKSTNGKHGALQSDTKRCILSGSSN